MGPLATDEDIYSAYRLLLGREPDQPGLEHYRRLLAQGPLPVLRLADFFVCSDEFKARRGHKLAPKEVEFGEYVMYVDPADHDVGATVAAGTYEPHVTQAVREYLHAGDTFIDVGANIGYFAAMAAHIAGPSGRVIAIEPMDKNVQLILRTVARNEFRNVEVHQCAASDQRRIVAMATGDGTSNGEIVAETARHRATVFAQACRLDEVLSGINRIDILKFDVEGHEMSAWAGFRESIARTRPMVLTEFHPKCLRENAGVEPVAYLTLLFEYATSIEVLISPHHRVQCRSVADVMREWVAADKRFNSGGTTHLDLLLKPG